MIRIEGIPMVTARLADAEKLKHAKILNPTHNASKMAARAEVPPEEDHFALKTTKVAA